MLNDGRNGFSVRDWGRRRNWNNTNEWEGEMELLLMGAIVSFVFAAVLRKLWVSSTHQGLRYFLAGATGGSVGIAMSFVYLMILAI